jgi:putative transposase
MKKTDKAFEFDYESVKNKALAQLKSGKPLLGKEGALGPLFKSFLEAALEAELEDHLQDNHEEESNRRNGHGTKFLRTSEGPMEFSTPRDRSGSFEPEIVEKRQTVTDRVIPAIKLWQAHELEDIYTIVWLDAMYYNVKDQSGHVVTRCLYNVLGINLEGRKHLLGIYVSESEGAKFWLSVLADMQQRGLKDILIACIDNLGGFEEAIASSRVGKGISAQASHKTVLETLASHGFSQSVVEDSTTLLD